MLDDKKLFKLTLVILALPIVIASGCSDRFRYPCQDSANWDKEFCKKPVCDITRTCPEHVFKGQRDPRLGPPEPTDNLGQSTAPAACPTPAQGANCGK